MSKKDLQKKRAIEARRAQLIADGVIQEDDDETEEQPQKHSMVVRKKKDKRKQNEKATEVEEKAETKDEVV